MHWIYRAWPSLLSQAPHLCHKDLQGRAIVKAEEPHFQSHSNDYDLTRGIKLFK